MVSLMDAALGKAQLKDEPVHLDLTGAFGRCERKSYACDDRRTFLQDYTSSIFPTSSAAGNAVPRNAACSAGCDGGIHRRPRCRLQVRRCAVRDSAGMTPQTQQPQAARGGVTFAPVEEQFGGAPPPPPPTWRRAEWRLRSA